MAESSKAKSMERALMERPGFGSEGRKLSLLTNHFNVNVSRKDGHFYQYDVRILLLYFELSEFLEYCI